MRHPRGHGAFARVLARYTGSGASLSLETAIHKMTGRTASIVGLNDPEGNQMPRGLVREGYAADLLAFDPAAVRDRADFTHPHRYAQGMKGVWVNGTRTWASDTLTASMGAGSVLRSRISE